MNESEFMPPTAPSCPSIPSDAVYDVIIIGGGPAGLSAALVLGRCRRKVLVIDAGEQRNRSSHAMHGYLSRDSVCPKEMLELCRAQVSEYPTVTLLQGCVVDAERTDEGCFTATTSDGARYQSRKMLLATGVVDVIPEIPGLPELYGSCVHHCPICDGYEWRDHPIAVYGKGTSGVGLVQEMMAWSRDLVLCTDGASNLDPLVRENLHSLGIVVREEPVHRLESIDGKLTRIHFGDGSAVPCHALFFCTPQFKAGAVASKLGCQFTEDGCIWTGDCETTNVPGLYCAGDVSRNAQMVIVAASEGAQAAVNINKMLTAEYKEAIRSAMAVSKSQ